MLYKACIVGGRVTLSPRTADILRKTIYQVNGNITSPYAYLEVQMQQEPDSWEVLTEIDPLNVGEILGSIGGFWGRFAVTSRVENGAPA